MIRIAYDPIYAHPLPEGHRFPMLKYELIPGQLLHEGSISEKNLFTPIPVKTETVLLTHDKEYLDKLINQTLSAAEQRRIGFPQSPELTQRELVITQGTIDCCYYAFEYGVALNIAGGTHHAFADRGEGFCLLNDMAVAANYLLREKKAAKIIIIDLDVHQGNGTAKLFENNPDVFTFSMHGAHNYPFHKEHSDLDLPLKDGTTGKEYLSLLQEALPHLIQKVQPDFAFYLSGVDILETDKFGKLKVTLDECKQRDAFVFDILRTNNIPVTVAMGGGYSPDVRIITEAHCNTFRLATAMY
ncbi:histone deacetylase family protein [Sediminibacterium goheungense]|uniref:Acetoin utilization deacetylase AcuC-like enzyme n=1 Tax=Sediminibacterium goheungense TaxID=1086393 RepID=A0A4R6J2V0_9BACT|nr:histone deacetylase [Sediminibacterium goheungense]TDO28495.1 acetoin utilization deacetylase AcuC-like enzyme [Sediminibacterium goheungense]